MDNHSEAVLALGMTPSEFTKELDPDIWQLFDSGVRRFIEACDGEFSAIAATAAQHKYQKQYVMAERELIALGIARLATEAHRVSGVMQGASNRTLIDSDVVNSLTIWHLRLGRLSVPHGRSFDHVRIQPPHPARPSRGTKPVYDWSQLRSDLLVELKQTHFRNPAELVKWCRANVGLCESGEKPFKSPDDATTRAAIIKYGLDKIAEIRMTKVR